MGSRAWLSLRQSAWRILVHGANDDVSADSTMARTRIGLIGAALLGGVALPLVLATHIAAQEGRSLSDMGLKEVVRAAVRQGGALVEDLTRQAADPDALVTASIPPRVVPSAVPPEEDTPGLRPGEAAPTPDWLGPPAFRVESTLQRPSPEAGLVRSVIALYRKGDIGAADLSASTLQDPAARAVLEWAAIRLQPLGLGFTRINAFLATNPDWPGRNGLRRRAEEALVAERRDGQTILAFFAEKKPLTTHGRLAFARALLAAGRTDEAAAAIRDLWRRDDLSAESEGKVLDAFAAMLTPADHRARIERELFAEDWAAAQRNAARLGEDWGKLVKARMAVDGNPAKAGAALDAVPKALQQDTSFLFARAQWLRKQNKLTDAARLLAGMSRDPEVLVSPSEWWAERRLLSRKLLDASEQKLAYDVAAGAPQGDPASMLEAEFQAGWIALRVLSDKEGAVRHFTAAAAVATTPISVSRAAYWQGRAAEAAGTDPASFYRRAASEPTTYYGQLARARLGLTDLPIRRVSSQLAPPLERLPAARAIRLLTDADARDLAAPLYSELAQSLTNEADLDALAGLAAEQGDARALLTVGKAAVQRGFPLDNHAFPLLGVPSFEPAGAAVDRSLVYAIARQESAFDPRAVSSAGARGLMQLMPATARATAAKAGLGFEPDRLTTDPAYNARLGAAHLGDLVADWKGSMILAIASYNAGPGNVRKWIEAYGDPRSSAIDPIDWVERIPFGETRNYVQRVIENLQVYRTRLGERATLLIDSDLQRGGR